MKTITGILLVMFIYSGTIISQPLQPEKIYEMAKDAVLYVIEKDNAGMDIGYGSAVLIDSNRIVTNYHVVAEALNLYFINGRDTIKNPDYLYIDPKNDIAVFYYENTKYPFLKIRDSKTLRIGEKIFALGNPNSFYKVFSEGIISSVNNDDSEYTKQHVIQFTANIAPGSSGGALIDEYGNLIGLTASSITKYRLNFAVPADICSYSKIINHDDLRVRNAFNKICANIDFNNNFYKGYTSPLYLDSCFYMVSNYPFILKELSVYYLAVRDYKKASGLTTIIDNSETADYEILKLKSNAFFKFYLLDSALYYINSAIKSNSKDKRLYLDRIEIYDEKELYDSSINDYFKLLEMSPHNQYYNMCIADEYLKLKDTVNAVKYLESSYVENEYNYTFSYRGSLFEKLGRYFDAIYNYTEAIKLDPEDYSSYFSRAVCYSKNDEPRNAIRDYLIYLTSQPIESSGFNNLAYNYLDINDFENAEKYFMMSIKKDEMHFDSYLGMAILNYRTGKVYNTGKYIFKAIKIKPVLSKGVTGLHLLEKKGYFWSSNEINELEKIFSALGIGSYKDEENRHMATRAED